MNQLYPVSVNSIPTTVTADIGDSDTIIPVAELGEFRPGENLAILGSGPGSETVRYAEK